MIGYVMSDDLCVKDLIEYGKYVELEDDYEIRTKYSLLILILAILFTGIIIVICLTMSIMYFME